MVGRQNQKRVYNMAKPFQSFVREILALLTMPFLKVDDTLGDRIASPECLSRYSSQWFFYLLSGSMQPTS